MKKKNLFLKSTSSLLAMLFVVMSAFMFTACDEETDDPDPEPEPENSILEIVSGSETHTQLEAFVTADTELAAALGGDDLTLFAPNDAAFDRLRTILDVESLDQVNPAVIGAVLRYHAVASVELRESFTEDTELTSLQGENITFNADVNIFNGGTDTDVEFIGDEILATNGVVHVVETILIPPSIFATIGANLGKVSQTVLLGADFSTLAAAIQKADEGYAASTEGVDLLSDILAGNAGSDQITVFAPVNQVFEAGSITLDTYTAQQWYGLIANHVLGSKKLSSDLVEGQGNVTLAGGAITLLPSGGLDSNGVSGAEATFAVDPETGEEIVNIESDNGVVHAIAGILAPASSGRYAVDAKYNFK
ncbi:fasciclin domain-containing protein [Marivirga tractuosa]|uniref:fasciclin domain-containing protein n=1 Tax=Marivirga tractuosa TaxID=1006 RepID=UPI0035CFA679